MQKITGCQRLINVLARSTAWYEGTATVGGGTGPQDGATSSSSSTSLLWGVECRFSIFNASANVSHQGMLTLGFSRPEAYNILL
ncbi:uncharacterized [Lates japonicus]